MSKNLNVVGQSIVLRLVVPIGIVVIVAVSLHLILLSSEEELYERKFQESEQVGALVEAMMLYDMRLNKLHDFQTYLNILPFGERLAAIRMYDNQGILRYAVGDSLIGLKTDRFSNPICAGCHQQETNVPTKNRNVRANEVGQFVFQVDFPLENSEECWECHGTSNVYLGNLLTEMTFSPAELRLIDRRRMMILAGTLVMLSAIAVIWSLLHYQVVKPVKDLVRVIEKSKDGILTERIHTRRRDEIGYLINSYNEMMDALLKLQNNLEEQVQTRTKELESSRMQLLLRENLASLGRMAAGIAHELGNPLTGISSLVQLVKRRRGDDSFIVEQLNLVHDEINRLTRLTHQMVDLARPEDTGKKNFDIIPSLNKAFQIARLDPKLRKRIVKMPGDAPPVLVEANEDAVIQIVMNLLFNAADFADDNGLITVNLKRGPNAMVEIRVTDNGSGIPEADQPHIFDPFFSGKRSGEGAGLGLSVSHSLARSFHGSLELERSDSGGTTFLLKLPCKGT